jgi:hypothetical protein
MLSTKASALTAVLALMFALSVRRLVRKPLENDKARDYPGLFSLSTRH